MTDLDIRPLSLRMTTSDGGDDQHCQAQGRHPGRPRDADQDQERHRDVKPNHRLSGCNMATSATCHCGYRPAATLQPFWSAVITEEIKIETAAAILSS